MRIYIATALIALIAAGFFWVREPVEVFPAAADPAVSPTLTASPMVAAAEAVLDGLTPKQREAATFPFEDPERRNWHYTPIDRKGVLWQDLDPSQRALVTTLLRTALSEQGYEKTREIMALENVLRELENRPPGDEYRHPESYLLSVFGEPSDTQPWGWRFEGHHVSLNFSSVTDKLSVTPSFFGSNPAKIPHGPNKGDRVLAQEEDIARQLIGELDRSQLKKAIIADTAPREIITGNDREVSLTEFKGLPYGEMSDLQQRTLQQLIRVYLDNMKPRIAQKQWERIEEAGLSKLYFAWAGSLERGEGHYYRIHGPTVLIEYDNTQNDANHIHTVWRDPTNDWGEDLLRRHYEHGHH